MQGNDVFVALYWLREQPVAICIQPGRGSDQQVSCVGYESLLVALNEWPGRSLLWRADYISSGDPSNYTTKEKLYRVDVK